MVVSPIGFKKLVEWAVIPYKMHAGDLGWDLVSTCHVELAPGRVTKIHTGIACSFPPMVGGLIRDRSSLAACGVITIGGVIDSEYTGELIVVLFNASGASYTVLVGEKIAQLVLVPVLAPKNIVIIHDLPETARGDKGFGAAG